MSLDAPRLPLPPGPRGVPVFGSLFSLGPPTGFHRTLNRFAQHHGDIYMLRLGSLRVVVLSHPDLVAEAFGKPELADHYVSPVEHVLNDAESAPLGLVPYGDRWRQLHEFWRRDLLDAENVDMVRRNHIEPEVDDFVARIAQMGEAGELFDSEHTLHQSVWRLTFRCVFGTGRGNGADFQALEDGLREHIEWFIRAINTPNPSDFVPWMSFLSAGVFREARRQKQVAEGILDALLAAARSSDPGASPAPGCLLDVLLAHEGDDIDAQTIRSVCKTDLVIATYLIVTQTLKWFLLIAANRPEIQARIHEEMATRQRPDTAQSTVDDPGTLPWTFACLAESMRFRSTTAVGIGRRASRDVQVGRYRVPAGAQVLANASGIHHDPRFWESPGDFVPERFMPAAEGPASALTSPAYLPFGAGVRRCPGDGLARIVLWTYVTRMPRRCRMEPPEGSPLPEEDRFGGSSRPDRSP